MEKLKQWQKRPNYLQPYIHFYTIANSVMLGCSQYLSILPFYMHEKWPHKELNKLYMLTHMNKRNSTKTLGYRFLSHSKFLPLGSHGWEGTSGMFPSSRIGTRTDEKRQCLTTQWVKWIKAALRSVAVLTWVAVRHCLVHHRCVFCEGAYKWNCDTCKQ